MRSDKHMYYIADRISSEGDGGDVGVKVNNTDIVNNDCHVFNNIAYHVVNDRLCHVVNNSERHVVNYIARHVINTKEFHVFNSNSFHVVNTSACHMVNDNACHVINTCTYHLIEYYVTYCKRNFTVTYPLSPGLIIIKHLVYIGKARRLIV